MGIDPKKKLNRVDDPLQDPLGQEETPSAKAKASSTATARQVSRPVTGSRARQQEMQRMEEIRRRLAEKGEDVNVDDVISMYMPRRRAKRFAAALLRMNKLKLLLLLLILILAILFILSFGQEKMGNFTINLNRIDMFRKGISLSATGDFRDPTARLAADPIDEAMNISIEDLPEDLDQIDGNHNGVNYLAYTYYIRNSGKENLNYRASIDVVNATKGAENAIRVAVWKNGERVVYAEPAKNGGTEKGCVNFLEHDVVCIYEEPEFLVGNVDKFTTVVWLEGDDPECVDSIVGGSIQLRMSFDSISNEEDGKSTLDLLIEDIKDMVNNNNPVMGSSEDEVPDYYKENNITYDNRRNQ